MAAESTSLNIKLKDQRQKEALQEIADREYEGVLSMTVRKAIAEFIARHQQEAQASERIAA